MVYGSKKFLLLLYSIVFFSILFGPKFGIIDTSVIGGLIGFIILLPIIKIKISKHMQVFLFIAGIIVLYSLIIYGLTGFNDSYVVLRNLRVFFSTIFIIIAISNVPFSKLTMLNIVVDILLLHALAILTQIIIPSTKFYFAYIYHFDKSIVDPLRAFGLTAGYDIAGYLCIVGVILTLLLVWYKVKFSKHMICATIFIIATIFTSRVSLIILSVILLIFNTIFIMRGDRKLKVIGLIYLIGIVAISIYYTIPLIMSTINIGHLSGFTSFQRKYTSYFAKTDIKLTFNRMWELPANEWGTLFGSGIDPDSDIGYIQIIFMTGIFGLFLIVNMYLLMLFKALKTFVLIKRCMRFTRNIYLECKIDAAVFLTLSIIILLQFMLDMKNLFFLTRSAYELLLILFSIGMLNNKFRGKL